MRIRERAWSWLWFAKELLICYLRHDWEPLVVEGDGFVRMICINCGARKMSRPAGQPAAAPHDDN